MLYKESVICLCIKKCLSVVDKYIEDIMLTILHIYLGSGID